MRCLVIGGTGHIGSYLVPRLVQEGHEVTVVARRAAPQYGDARLGWSQVRWVIADRGTEEANGTWRQRMEELEADVVVDLICYTPAQNAQMMAAFEGRISQFLHCGTIWSYGRPCRVPYRESDPRAPITQYGIDKAQIEADLLSRYRETGFPATVIHPGHICGRQWLPIDPQGTRNGVEVYGKLSRGEAVHLPRFGRETLHHVHADDLAQLFHLAVERRGSALGEAFSGVGPYAVSLVGLCEIVARMLGAEANVEFVSHGEMARRLGDAWAATEDHLIHSPCCSIEKAQRLLGYAPRYTTEQIFAECLDEVLRTGELRL